MKLLVKFTSSLTPVVDYELEPEKALRGVVAWLKNPRVVGDYTLAGTRHSVSIWEGDSLEQLHVDIMALPSHRLGEWEVVPLIDNREGNWLEKVSDPGEFEKFVTDGGRATRLIQEHVATREFSAKSGLRAVGEESLAATAVAVSAAACVA